MPASELLKQAVVDGDLILIRSIVSRQISSDCKKEIFQSRESIEYIEEHEIEVFQLDDSDSVFTANRELWTKDLWDHLLVELNYNFSREKVGNMWDMISHFRQTGHPEFQIENRQVIISPVQNNSKGTAPSNSLNGWWIAGGIAVLACAFLAYKALTK